MIQNVSFTETFIVGVGNMQIINKTKTRSSGNNASRTHYLLKTTHDRVADAGLAITDFYNDHMNDHLPAKLKSRVIRTMGAGLFMAFLLTLAPVSADFHPDSFEDRNNTALAAIFENERIVVVNGKLAQPSEHIYRYFYPKQVLVEEDLAIRSASYNELSAIDVPIANGLSGVDAPVAGELSGVDAPVADELSGVDAPITGELSGVDAPITGELSGVDAHITGELSGVDARITGKLSGVDAPVADELYVADAPIVGGLSGVDAPIFEELPGIGAPIFGWLSAFSNSLADSGAANAPAASFREVLARRNMLKIAKSTGVADIVDITDSIDTVDTTNVSDITGMISNETQQMTDDGSIQRGSEESVEYSEAEVIAGNVATQPSTATMSSAGYIWPAQGNLTSGFGYRNATVGSKNHKGIDICAKTGDPIYAAAAGEVIVSERSGSFGYYIQIQHDNGHVSLYAHCSSLIASVGDRVEQGQKIALMGRTGRATAVHLHFELKIDGVNVDPVLYLP